MWASSPSTPPFTPPPDRRSPEAEDALYPEESRGGNRWQGREGQVQGQGQNAARGGGGGERGRATTPCTDLGWARESSCRTTLPYRRGRSYRVRGGESDARGFV